MESLGRAGTIHVLQDCDLHKGLTLGSAQKVCSDHVSGTAPNFTQSASPTTVHILPGQTGTATVTVTTNDSQDNATVGGIYFTASGYPSGSTATVSPDPITPHA